MASVTERIRSIVDFDYSQVQAGASRVSSQFREIAQRGRQAGRNVAGGFKDMAGGARGARSSIDEVTDSSRQQESQLTSLTGTLRTVAQAYIALRGATEVYQAAREGAVSLELEQAFGQELARTGQQLDEFIAHLSEAAGGTVAEFDLMKSASRAMLLNVGSDAEQLGTLMEIARFRARLMGMETTEAFGDIVTGIGRASPLILDNLGIIIDGEKVYTEYAESIGKSRSELTKFEETQALTNAVVEDGRRQIDEAGGVNDTTADSFRNLEASIQDATTAWKQLLAATGAGVLAEWATNLARWTGAAADTQRQMQVIEGAVSSATRVIEKQGGMMDATRVSTLVWGGEMEEARQIMEKYPGAMEAFNRGAKIVGERNGIMAATTDDVAVSTEEAITQLINIQGPIDDYTIGMTDAAAATAAADAELEKFIGRASGITGVDLSALTGDLEAQADKAQELLEQRWEGLGEDIGMGGVDFGLIRATKDYQAERAAISKEAADERVQDELDAAEKAAEESLRLSKQTADETTKLWEQAWDDRRQQAESALGVIESAVSGALDLSGAVTELEMLQTELGVYVDGVDENIRRLNAVARDPDDPLLNLLPDDIRDQLAALEGVARQVRAMELAEETRRGLRPELINVDALIREARIDIIGKRNLEQVQQEATQQLVEEGFLLSEIEFAIDQDQVRSNIVAGILTNERAQLEAKRGEVEALADDFVGIINTRLTERIGEIDAIDLLLENFSQRLLAATEQVTTGR